MFVLVLNYFAMSLDQLVLDLLPRRVNTHETEHSLIVDAYDQETINLVNGLDHSQRDLELSK